MENLKEGKNVQKKEQKKEETSKKGKTSLIVIIISITIPIVILLLILFGNMAFMIFNSARRVANEANNAINSDADYNYDSNNIYNDGYNNNNNIDDINLLTGRWVVEVDGKLEKENYFEFNDDYTFSYASSGAGVITGTYSFEYGVTTVTGEKKYDTGGYTLYYVMLIPEEAKLDDGRIITDNLNNMEYSIGVNGDKMISQNLQSRNITSLQKQE